MAENILLVFRSAPLTFQALSDEDRKLWLDAMDGREPVCDVVHSVCLLHLCKFHVFEHTVCILAFLIKFMMFKIFVLMSCVQLNV